MKQRDKKGQNRSLPLTLITLALSVSACSGGEGDNPLPVGANVEVTPTSHGFTIPAPADPELPCLIDPRSYIDRYLNITVATSNGAPIGDADLTVALDYSGNTFSGYPVLELFDDLNGNGVADAPEERVSDADDPLFRTSTAEYTGEKLVIVRINTSCPYEGIMTVFSDGFVGHADFSVTWGDAATSSN